MAAESSQVKNFVAGVIRLSDGTGTPVTLTLGLDRGDFSISNLMAKLNETVKIETRGKFKTLARGNRVYPAFSLSAWAGNIVGSSAVAPGTPLEFLFGKGAYSANVSTLGASREMTVDIRLTVEGTAWGDTADETIDLEDVVCSIEFAEAADGNTISMSGEVLGAVVITNNTNTVTLSQVS